MRFSFGYVCALNMGLVASNPVHKKNWMKSGAVLSMSEILITLDWMGLRPRGVACQFMQLSCNFRGIKAISNPLATAYTRRYGHDLMGKSCM